MSGRPASMWWAVAAAAALGLIIVPLARDDDERAAAFDGYVQAGTCADPDDEFRADLEGDDGAGDVQPYVAVGDDGEAVTLGYYGAPGLPGLGLAAIYADQQFSMVITEAGSDTAVACGEVLRPADDRFEADGLAVVQLLAVDGSDVQGFAAIERARLQRELDITPTRARIILSTDPISVAEDAGSGFEGHVRSGRCEAPAEDLRAELESEDERDVLPFQAVGPGASDPVTIAYYGSAGVPGFGLAAASTDEVFSVVIEGDDAAAVACGDVLEPDDEQFTSAGLSLVQLRSTEDAGIRGFGLLDRVGMQRELDVTPTVLTVLLFAPPASGE